MSCGILKNILNINFFYILSQDKYTQQVHDLVFCAWIIRNFMNGAENIFQFCNVQTAFATFWLITYDEREQQYICI